MACRHLTGTRGEGDGTLEGALALAGNEAMVSRSHFARHLAHSGWVKHAQAAFDKYLGSGKPAYVAHRWASLDNAVAWIRAAGGTAVLAHPGRYMVGRSGMGKKTMQELLTEFVEIGGQAIEVVTGSHAPEQYAEFARYAEEFGLLCSCGSDFHGPGESWRDMGRLPDFPLGCRPVWQAWQSDTAVKAA